MRFVTRVVLAWTVLPTLLCGCGSPPGRGRLVTVPLEIVASRGVWTDARSARLFRDLPCPGPGGRIWMEAEQADDLVTRPAGHARDEVDADASGRRFVRDISTARWYLHAESARAMDLWFRLCRPDGDGSGNRPHAPPYHVLLNGKPLERLPVAKHDRPANWHWVKLAHAAVLAGENLIEVASSSHPAMKGHGATVGLDAVQLVPAGAQPVSVDDARPRRRPVAEGMIETTDVEVPGLLALESLGFDDGSAGLVMVGTDVWCSTDGGRSWQRVTAGGLPARRDGPVRFRIALQPGPRGGRPHLRGLSLRARVDPSRFIELSDETSRLVVDAGTGGLFLVEDTAAGQVLCAPGRPWPLGAVVFKEPGREVHHRVDVGGESSPRPPTRVDRTGSSLSVHHYINRPGLGRARVVHTVESTGEGTWSIRQHVEALAGPGVIVEQVCPILPRVRIGHSGLDDRQRYSTDHARRILRPGRASLAPLSCTEPDRHIWTDIADPNAALRLEVHGQAGAAVVILPKAGGPAADALHLEARRRGPLRPGESATWGVTLRVHGGQGNRP